MLLARARHAGNNSLANTATAGSRTSYIAPLAAVVISGLLVGDPRPRGRPFDLAWAARYRPDRPQGASARCWQLLASVVIAVATFALARSAASAFEALATWAAVVFAASVVSGAASGIGRATCLRMAGAGARVLATDVAATGGDLAAEIAAAGGEGTYRTLDVVDEEAWRQAMDDVVTRWGQLGGAR